MRTIRSGDQFIKPGWVRLSIHPTMTNAEIDYIMDAIELTASCFEDWGKDYGYDDETNEYVFEGIEETVQERVEGWFNVGWAGRF